MSIDATIQRLTNDGEVVVQFLVDVIQGTNYNAPIGHRIKSAEWLSALGGFIPEDAIPKSASIRPRPKSETKRDKRDKKDKKDEKPPVTEKQILHFEIARLIKEQTQDGKTAIDFLTRVVAKGERPKSGENFTVAARMRATRELLIRGFGSSDGSARRILSGDTEDLGSDLAKRIRGCSNDGAELVHLLINAMENKNPEAASKGAQNPYPKFERQRKTKPAEGFTASQRVWSACELLRRAYDIRTDHITPDDIQAYRNAQTPTAKAAGAANSEMRPAAVNEKRDADAENPAGEQPAAAKNIAAAENPAADNTPSDTPDRAARRRQQRDARKAQKPAITTEQRDDHKQRDDAKNITAAEKPATTADRRDADNRPAPVKVKPNAEQPAANPDSAPAAETRASRRRQKRAARKAQKRAANTRPDTPIRSVYPEDIADTEAYKERLQARSDAIRDAKLRNVDIRKIPELKRHITPEEVAAFQRQPGNLYNRTREMYKEKYGEYPFPDDIPANARSP